MPRPLLLLGGLLVLSLVPASASPRFTYREFTNYCSTGALVTCASVQLRVWSTSTNSVIVIRFQNRQGSDYGFDNSGGSSLSYFEMRHHEERYYGVPYPLPTNLPIPDPWFGTVGNVGRVGQLPDIWDATLDAGFLSQWVPGGLGKGVFGCDPLPIDPDAPPLDRGANGLSGALITCPSAGYGGWVQMSVVIDIPSEAADWDLYWSMEVNRRGPPYGASCSTVDQGSCVTMTPEPVTMSLLATGLAGVGLARRRRRVSCA